MQAEDIPPPAYQESTPSATGSASTRTRPMLFGTVGVHQHDPLFFPILNITPSDESNDQDMDSDHGNGNDISDDIDASGSSLPRTLQRILWRLSFSTLLSVFCTILLLLCIVNNAIDEINSITSTLVDAVAEEIPRQILTNKVPTNVALNFTAPADRDSFLILSTTVSNAAMNWQNLNCDVTHTSHGLRCCPLFDALHDFARAATANSRERQMLLARLEGVLDATSDMVSAPEATVRHFAIGELHSKLTRAITAVDAFDTTLLAADAALGRVRLHYHNEDYSLIGTTNTIMAVIRGSRYTDARKKDLLRQLSDWDVPALAYISSVQQVVFQIKARLVELGEQVHRLDNVYDGKATGWQVTSVERVGRRIEQSMSVLRG